MTNEPIAIIGAACHYPDARSPAELWENVLAGRRAFRRLPDCRLRSADYFSEDPLGPDSTYASQAAVITNYEFDRTSFRVANSTFRSADMAHWLALDVATRAFADADFPDGKGLPKDQVGVLIGNSLTGEFSRANVMRLRWPYVRRTIDAALAERDWTPQDRVAFLESLEQDYKAPFPPVSDETLAGGLSNTIAGRICNYFDLRGGGYTVDGACASSLLAVANACTALTAHDMDIALAGGVDLSLDPFELVGFAKVGALAKNEMRVYDARSAGFWPGEGCGMVVLMRASDAVTQGRRIYALLRGWGISSDGSGGITRPEVEGQKLALKRAYHRAGIGADSVGYFEGHGTGTSVGDATELEAVLSVRSGDTLNRGEALAGSSAPAAKAAISSIKANIGHTKAAAGVAGLLKATLALHHQTLPPSVGWEQPHSLLCAKDSSLELLRQASAWPAELPLRAGVSAMGFGGINAHLVLEAANVRQNQVSDSQTTRLISSMQDAELFLFGGESWQEVEDQLRRVAKYAAQISFAELSDLAAELARSLKQGLVRAAVVASRPAELQRSLETLLEWIAGGTERRIDVNRGLFLAKFESPPTIGYLFPGQGTDASLDGAAWANRFPAVRKRYQGAQLPAGGNVASTEIAHPAIITAVLAGLDILQQVGIEATLAVGHSLGELAAYHWSGAFDEAMLMRLATARGRAIAEHGQSGGAMAGIAAPCEVIERLIGNAPVVIAGVNSPVQTVISGETSAVDEVVQRAAAAGLHATRLAVSHAFHSPLVAGAVPALSSALEQEPIQPPTRLVASTITGGLLDGGEDLRELLRRQLTSPVRLMDAVHAAELKVDLWIEVGPGHVISGIVGKMVDAPVVSLEAGGDSLRDLLRAIGAAFTLARRCCRWRFLTTGSLGRSIWTGKQRSLLTRVSSRRLLMDPWRRETKDRRKERQSTIH